MVHRFTRTEILIGQEGLEVLRAAKVAVFGVGGVGSFTVEALARAGVGGLVLVDHDEVCVSNINRQIHALTGTVGRAKVEVMRERVLGINPGARVEAIKRLYCAQNAEELLSTGYDYVVDAIDMVSSKLDLIERCDALNIPIVSSMGAGNKLDPTLFEVADIYETSVCPLARVIRKELRKRGIANLKVVYSTESPVVQKSLWSGDNTGYGDEWAAGKARKPVPGSISFVPPVAGLIIAGEVVKGLLSKERKK